MRAPLYVSKELAFSDSSARETNVTVMKWERQTYWPLWLQRTFAACIAWQLMVRMPDPLTLVASENICCLHCMAIDGENTRPTDPCGFSSENICCLPCMANIASPHYCCVKKCIESWGSKSLHRAFSGQLLCVGCIIYKQGQPLCVNCIVMEKNDADLCVWVLLSATVCKLYRNGRMMQICVVYHCLSLCVTVCIFFFFFRLTKKVENCCIGLNIFYILYLTSSLASLP